MVGPRAIRVLLADDHVIVREGLSQILEESDRIRVIGQASNGTEVMEFTKTTRPDVIVLDYSMPGVDTPYVIKHVRTESPSVKVLILTIHENIHYAVKVLECGAHVTVVAKRIRPCLAKLEGVSLSRARVRRVRRSDPTYSS